MRTPRPPSPPSPPSPLSVPEPITVPTPPHGPKPDARPPREHRLSRNESPGEAVPPRPVLEFVEAGWLRGKQTPTKEVIQRQD
jgi:hypothetical protein